ncbi:hypothetical protein, partial [Teichococcus cervicalis]|uniref:hypothetical protein n=1 Tax=Teichococcus cervicalis TaxID=204525 RepID=UPI00058AF4A0
MTTQSLTLPRGLGWGASVALHGGAAAFLLFGLPPHAPPPLIVPLEMAAPAPVVQEAAAPAEVAEAV